TFGVPLALFVFGRDLLPTRVVKPSVMWTALKSPDDGHLFLQGLYLAAWVGWLLFFLSVFLEIVAHVQHRAALRLPGLGWLQLGDPNRFADIAKLNDGRVMPGGTVFHYDEFLQSGWVLIMPPDIGHEHADAAETTQARSHTPTAAPALPAPSGTKTYTVRQGD